MRIKKLKLNNFRNIKQAEFDLGQVNAFIGNNAQGKTNLCEAAAVALGRSFRKAKTSEISPVGEKAITSIEIMLTGDEENERTNTVLYEQNGAEIKHTYNGIDIKQARELYNELRYVIFIPEDLYLVKGNPDLRRDFIDSLADQLNKIHSERVSEYKRALVQKNNFLSSLRSEYLSQSELLQYQIWNENLARLGVNVLCGRMKYFSLMCKAAARYYKELNNNNEELSMKYESSVAGEDFDYSDIDFLLNAYMDKLEKSRERELQLRFTQTGVHRDDISFYINGMNAKTYASQGQIRSIALSLRLAQAELLEEKWRDKPLIILDDVLSELDEYRRGYVLHHIVNSQIFITGCNLSDFADIRENKCWRVENGVFTQLS